MGVSERNTRARGDATIYSSYTVARSHDTVTRFSKIYFYTYLLPSNFRIYLARCTTYVLPI